MSVMISNIAVIGVIGWDISIGELTSGLGWLKYSIAVFVQLQIVMMVEWRVGKTWSLTLPAWEVKMIMVN